LSILPMIVSFLQAAVFLLAHMVLGYRIHRWLYLHVPYAYLLPTDFVAWCGLACGFYFFG